MKLQEAIQHADEQGQGATRCAAEHRQLAQWLKERQRHRETVRWERRMEQFAKASEPMRGEQVCRKHAMAQIFGLNYGAKGEDG